jgi:hypothetical protein
METDLNRQRLADMEKKVLRPGSTFEAEVALYSVRGECPDRSPQRFVVKDCLAMHPLVRVLIGRRVKRREIGAYRHLSGIPGVPAFLGRIDRDAFAVEYASGRTMARQLDAGLLEKAFASLASVLAGMHARRVVHLDLKQKRNVIVRADGSVTIIDFESALRIPRFFPGNLLLAFLKRRDRAGLIKFKAKYAPHLLTPEEGSIARRDWFLGILWPFKRITRFFRRFFGFS